MHALFGRVLLCELSLISKDHGGAWGSKVRLFCNRRSLQVVFWVRRILTGDLTNDWTVTAVTPHYAFY